MQVTRKGPSGEQQQLSIDCDILVAADGVSLPKRMHQETASDLRSLWRRSTPLCASLLSLAMPDGEQRDSACEQLLTHLVWQTKACQPPAVRSYSGMIAWRGVVEAAKEPQLYRDLCREYRHLGKGIIFDLAPHEMALTYMIPGNRINWLWCALLRIPLRSGAYTCACREHLSPSASASPYMRASLCSLLR